MQIEIPYNFVYRSYQLPLLHFIRNGGKRGMAIWHRRAGKDKVFFNIAVEMALRHKAGYAYVLPTYAQGKKIIWDSMDKDGKKFRDHIAPGLLKKENASELKFELVNGSFIQVLGSENIDTLRGISPYGIIFSEYAFQNPTAWEVMRPILAENGGWALFNSTPNGKNHFFDLKNMAEKNADWFHQVLTIDDTGVVDPSYIIEERAQGMSEEMIQQEYYCSFDVGALGSYYADQVQQARQDNRIAKLPYNQDIPMDLYFDIGVNDLFTISFKQNDGMFFNFINYYENSGKSLDHYFSYIDDYIGRMNGKIGSIFLPHDASHKGQAYLISGLTIFEKFQQKYGSSKVRPLPVTKDINIGIQEARKLFPRCRFDSENCVQFIRALENYKKDYDDKKKTFRNDPCHDWASHAADNLRYFAESPKDSHIKPKPIQKTYFNRKTGKIEFITI